MARESTRTSPSLAVARLSLLLPLPLLVIGCGSDPEPFEFERAPIVLVDVSGLRADRLDAAAFASAALPELEALTAESVRFEWAFTPSPHPGPARAALLSGRYPVALGLLAGGGELPEETVTLAERLGERGYRTAAFVDPASGAEDAEAGGAVSGTAQGFETWQEVDGGGLEAVLGAAVEWLPGAAGAPFFLYLQASDLLPVDAELATASDPVAGDAVNGNAVEADGAAGSRPDELYDTRVRSVDAAIGKLLRALDEQGLGASAIVVLTSDRGLELAGPGERHAGDVHATVARVPLLLRLPERVSRVEPRITDLVDLAPTLLDLVGLEADSAMQGESLVAILDQRGRPPYLAFTDSMEPDGGLAVAMAGYRLVLRRGEDRAELYRLADDPLELADLSAAEPEKVAVLRRRLEEWQRGVLGLGAGADGESAGDEMLEQLRNLGYIQ